MERKLVMEKEAIEGDGEKRVERKLFWKKYKNTPFVYLISATSEHQYQFLETKTVAKQVSSSALQWLENNT